MSAWLGRAALLLGRPGGPAAVPSSCLGSLRGPRCCCRRRPGSLRGGAEGLLLPRGSRALGTHPKKEPMEALNTAQGARDFIYSLHSTERSCLLRELHRFESIAIAQDPISARGGCQQYGETWAHQEPNGASSSAHSQAYHQKDAVPPANCPSTKYDRTHYLWPPLMAEAAGKPILCCGCYAEGRPSEKLEVAPPSPGQLRHVFFHNALPFVGFGFLDNAIMIAAGTQIELSIGVVLGISTMAAAALGNLVSDLAGLGLAGYVEALASRLGLSIPDLTPKQADMWQTRLSAHLSIDKAPNDCEKCQCRLEVMSCISRIQLQGAGVKKTLQAGIWCCCSCVRAAELCWHRMKTHQSGGAAADFKE
ncbi:transmembrane protein 65 isoform X1 [Taeniopygia guttata]|uniref:transmembrane protein 65 isoform X1 n=1 Tax=Taeniopygia guttata TaxID=59729 RepID=UPI003BB89E8B